MEELERLGLPYFFVKIFKSFITARESGTVSAIEKDPVCICRLSKPFGSFLTSPQLPPLIKTCQLRYDVMKEQTLHDLATIRHVYRGWFY